MATFDSILNVLVPALILLVVIGFVWVKTPLGAWLGPILSHWWENIRSGSSNAVHNTVDYTQRIITYE